MPKANISPKKLARLQAQLQAAGQKFQLDVVTGDYAPLSHSHVIAQVSGLQTALDGKQPFLAGVNSYNTSASIGASVNVALVDATGGPVTMTLPAAATAGRTITVKKVDASGNAVTVDGNGAELIDGAATHVLAALDDSVTIVSDGTGWRITGSN